MLFERTGPAGLVLLALLLSATAAGAQESAQATSLARRPLPTFVAPAPAAHPLPALELPAPSSPRSPTPYAAVAADTPVAAIEYSDWYGRRLVVHRVASYTMLPLFAAQYYAGSKLISQGQAAPDWARTLHGPLAATVAGVFAVNTVTGGWNLWEGRKDPEGRRSRTLHALLMLTADAGFAATGFLACEAEEDPGCNSNRHRTVAVSSMGLAAASYLIMLPPFRR